jgi:hypothetical protein
MSGLTFDTNAPAQVKGLGGWTVDPIFTVGDKIGTYVPPGILDGIGAFSLNDTTVRLYVNHELGNTVGYKYSLANGTQLTGARVSYFDVDKRTFQIVDSGLAYNKVINRAGNEVKASTLFNSSTNANGLDAAAGFGRFCSASLFEANQFGAGIGLVDRIFFTGEESDNGTEYALDTATNTLYAVPWFGRAAWENVTELNTGVSDKVAFLVGDDSNNAPLYLYVGNKKGTSFLERNGLADGKLFVWVADDPASLTDAIELDPSTFKGNNTSLNGKFVEIAYYAPALANTTGYDSQGFATQLKQNELAFAPAVSAFKFSRPEDIATNPKDGTQAVLASTGASTSADVFGTTYKIDVDFVNFTTNNFTAKIDILVDSNVDGATGLGLRSPDNLDWADDGKIYLQEDRAVSATQFGGSATTKQETSIFSIDPAITNPSSTLTRIAQIDRLALPATQTDSAAGDLGNWETSGILDVSTLFGAKAGEVLVFDVQAGGLRNGTIISASGSVDTDGNGTVTAEDNLVRGGQLSFLIAPTAKLVQNAAVVGGGVSDDTLDAGLTAGFDGVNDIVFTGAGNDTVSTVSAGTLASGNRIDTGSGDDRIFAANNDVVFGGSGSDRFEARDVSGYRLSGGAGNDTFYLGSNGRAIGGDGDDRFFVSEGGGNLISGGAGMDQFWIFTAGNPASPNTIIDFQAGTDVIGLVGAGLNFGSLGISGNTISLAGTTLATLTGFTGTLTNANFAFSATMPV